MTQRNLNNLPDIVIAGAAQFSNSFDAIGSFSDCETLTLFAAVIDGTKTYSIQVSNDGILWYQWQDGTANILPPTFGNACTYGNPGARFFRIAANAVCTGCTWHAQTSYYA